MQGCFLCFGKTRGERDLFWHVLARPEAVPQLHWLVSEPYPLPAPDGRWPGPPLALFAFPTSVRSRAGAGDLPSRARQLLLASSPAWWGSWLSGYDMGSQPHQRSPDPACTSQSPKQPERVRLSIGVSRHPCFRLQGPYHTGVSSTPPPPPNAGLSPVPGQECSTEFKQSFSPSRMSHGTPISPESCGFDRGVGDPPPPHPFPSRGGGGNIIRKIKFISEAVITVWLQKAASSGPSLCG